MGNFPDDDTTVPARYRQKLTKLLVRLIDWRELNLRDCVGEHVVNDNVVVVCRLLLLLHCVAAEAASKLLLLASHWVLERVLLLGC